MPETRFEEAIALLARSLAGSLGGLLSGARLRISCSAAQTIAPAMLAERVGAVAGNCLFRFAGTDAQVLASIPLRELIALTDRVFGGDGDAPETMPADIPFTADLLAGQVEALLGQALDAALVSFGRPDVAARSPAIGRLAPFAGAAQYRAFDLTVHEPGRPDWTILLAVSPEGFDTLFAAEPKVQLSPAARHDPLTGPFADLPLAVGARLAEMDLPLARVSNLRPGDIIPLVPFREVPLYVSETTFAYGSVGAVDERVALRLTRTM